MDRLAGHAKAAGVERHGVPTTVSLSYLVVPACGLIASLLWLGETLPFTFVVGGALILFGVAAIAVGDTRLRRA